MSVICKANGPLYQVPTGRRDGFVSEVSLADAMPEVTDSMQQLKSKFQDKGLTDKDLVLLSGNKFILIQLPFSLTHSLTIFDISPTLGEINRGIIHYTNLEFN